MYTPSNAIIYPYVFGLTEKHTKPTTAKIKILLTRLKQTLKDSNTQYLNMHSYLLEHMHTQI